MLIKKGAYFWAEQLSKGFREIQTKDGGKEKK